MKVADLKQLLADFPDDARIYQPKRGIMGVLTVTHKGNLIASIDAAQSGFDTRPHKQRAQKNEKATVNQRIDDNFFKK